MSESKSNVPKLRFPGFTEPWEQRKLGELYEKAGSGGTPSAGNAAYYDGEIPFLGISDLSGRFVSTTLKHITKEGLNNSAAWIVPSGAIALAMYASVGKVAITCCDLATSQAFYNMVFSSDVLRDFVYTRLNKADMNGEWMRLVSTGTQSNLNAEKVRSWQIAIPSEAEQHAIGAFFRNLDNLITLHQRKLDHVKQLKRGLLQKMFPRDGASVPEIRFPGFTDPWEQRKLGAIVKDIAAGKSVNSDDGQVGPNDIGVMKTSCVSYDRFEPSECKRVASEEVGLVSCPVEADSIVVSRMNTPERVGSCGFVAASYSNLYLPDRLWRVKLTNSTNTFLVYLILSSYRSKAKLRGMASGTSGSMHNIPKDAFLNMELILPCNIAEQRAISSFFSSLNNLITLHQRKLDHVKLLKKALLQQMFV